MTKAAWMNELKGRLSSLPDYERDKTISFYGEIIEDRIEDGMSEAEAVATLGSIDNIVSEILIDTPLTTLIQSKLKESHKQSKHKTLWLVLVICGFPLWLPLALAFACVIFAVYISVWALVISLFAAEFSFAVTGIFGFLYGAVLCFQSLPSGFALIGASLIAGGLFIMSIKPVLWLCKQFLALTHVFLRKLKAQFISNKEAVS